MKHLFCVVLFCILLLSVTSFANDLVGYWKFEEASGNLVDASGHGNTGVPAGNPTYQQPGAPNRGYSMAFDGSGDYVDCGDSASLDITDAITIEAWVKRSGDHSNEGIIYKGTLSGAQGVFQITHNTSGVELRLNNDAVRINTPFSQDEWHHVVGVYDKSLGSENAKLYLDGVQKDQANYAAGITSAPTSNVYVGAYYSSSYSFTGSIDEVKIYNYARSAAQIRHSYNYSLMEIDSVQLENVEVGE